MDKKIYTRGINMRYISDYFSMCDKCGKIILYRRLYHFKRKKRVRCQHCFLEGKANPLWKGDDVGYDSLHRWVTRHKPKPKVCEICKTKEPYDLANISGKYKRDVSDFQWLCRSCHMKSDGRLNNLKKGRC
jgi:hypothetical protein